MLLIATLLTSNAWAGSCDAALNRIDSLTKDTVVSGFVDLAKCDRKLAETHFTRFLSKATDADGHRRRRAGEPFAEGDRDGRLEPALDRHRKDPVF